jgi:hypothetical protein
MTDKPQTTNDEKPFVSDAAGQLAKNIRDHIEGKFCGMSPDDKMVLVILAHDIQHTINDEVERLNAKN